jgi:L1 cell adhesion molecule like protein
VAETVLQNKEDCIEIDKRMSRVSAILSQLEKTEMLEEQDMENALTKLLETFLYAHSLVLDCQSSGVATIFFCRPPCKLSNQLRVVLDGMVSDINAIIAVLVNHTLHPQRYLFFEVKRAFINHAISHNHHSRGPCQEKKEGQGTDYCLASGNRR